MRCRELIVLKLGGSVLRDRDALAQAVHEVYRWKREGNDVVAVVSALEGETDRLLAEARSVCEEPDALHCAALLATGELRSAALLALALQRAGLEARSLTPQQVNLRVVGAGLDAEPAWVDAARIGHELDAGRIVVIPGFIGIGDEGELCTLGRGGSDLSALYIAHALRSHGKERVREGAVRAEGDGGKGVRCRLVKDVPGLYTRDPRKPGPRARLLAEITFADALALAQGGSGIIQHKAVRFAAALGYEFEVGGLHAEFSTRVGTERTEEADEEQEELPRPLRVVLLGLGTVGLGVYRRLSALPEQFVVTAAVCRNVSRAASQGVEPSILRAGAASVFAQADILDNCDVLIEAIGGIEPAGGVVEAALARGIHVVTANKALVAARLPALRAIARASGAELRFAAAVGGAAPIVEAVERASAEDHHGGGGIERIEGVLNGTVNFILEAVARGVSFDDALADAQRRGLAEADPTRDLSGRDAADKLAVLSAIVSDGECVLDAADVPRDEVNAECVGELIARLGEGEAIRQVATLELDEDGQVVRAEIRLRIVPREHVLARLPGAANAAVITGADGEVEVVRAAGAGRWPTTEAVVGDALEIVRGRRGNTEGAEQAEVSRGEVVSG